MKTYSVDPFNTPLAENPAWDQPPWAGLPVLTLAHYMGARPVHFPRVQAKLGYADDFLAVFFRVADRFICARKQRYQERVCEDSCVEFFFTPGSDLKAGYFNFEINCGGTVFFHHQTGRGRQDVAVANRDFAQVDVFASLSSQIDPEQLGPLTWTVAFCLPYSVLTPYAPVTRPAPGVIWRANFYKCADLSSHPHWLTWAPVDLPEPDFHQPEFFGELVFR